MAFCTAEKTEGLRAWSGTEFFLEDGRASQLVQQISHFKADIDESGVRFRA